MAERLTEIRARKELAPARGQTILWDTDVKGFALRVTPGGAKSFLLDYRVDGRQRRNTIGSFPDWSVQAARTRPRNSSRRSMAATIRWANATLPRSPDAAGSLGTLRD